jgi:hypothetical protein
VKGVLEAREGRLEVLDLLLDPQQRLAVELVVVR